MTLKYKKAFSIDPAPARSGNSPVNLEFDLENVETKLIFAGSHSLNSTSQYTESLRKSKDRKTVKFEIICMVIHLHSKKYQNFPIVLGWKFKGNGQVSEGNSREREVSISPLGNYGNCVRFPKTSPTRNVVKFHYFLQCLFHILKLWSRRASKTCPFRSWI